MEGNPLAAEQSPEFFGERSSTLTARLNSSVLGQQWSRGRKNIRLAGQWSGPDLYVEALLVGVEKTASAQDVTEPQVKEDPPDRGHQGNAPVFL